jgi:DNA-binding response OmpR family regulator
MSQKRTALVVEDTPHIRLFVRTVLTKAGYEVYEAETGESALALVIKHRPDIILLDVMLASPMDGLTVCHEIRSIAGLESTPVIIISALDQKSDLAAGKLYGADDYLTKPFSAAALLEHVGKLVDKT